MKIVDDGSDDGDDVDDGEREHAESKLLVRRMHAQKVIVDVSDQKCRKLDGVVKDGIV